MDAARYVASPLCSLPACTALYVYYYQLAMAYCGKDERVMLPIPCLSDGSVICFLFGCLCCTQPS